MLKYLVLANMLMGSEVNPFDGQLSRQKEQRNMLLSINGAPNWILSTTLLAIANRIR